MACRISTDWKYRGIRTLIMENSLIRMVVLLDKGGDIMEILYKPLDLDFMWHSPIGWKNPRTGSLPDPNTAGVFLDYYGGGWQNIAPSAGGKNVSYRGAELGIHGESSILPWRCEVLIEDADEVMAHLWVEGVRYPFRLDRWITVRDREEKIYSRERLTNPSRQTLEYSWLQHPAFGEPFLEPGCIVRIPTPATVIVEEGEPYGRLKPGTYSWPTALSKDGKLVDLSVIPPKDVVAGETSFITDLKEGWYVLSNPRLGIGFGLAWDLHVYKYIWFWQNYNLPDYPWYGMAWNIALEPCTSYPGGLPSQVERKTHLSLPPRGFIEANLTIFALRNPEKVNRLKTSGEIE